MRAILKNWKLNAIASISLTIAMALAIVAFTISDAILLRPPVAKNPGELVSIFTDTPKERFVFVSYQDYEYLRDHNTVFTDVAAYPDSIGLTAQSFEGRFITITNSPVSDNYFSVMGIQPVIGRFFEKGDEKKKTPVLVLTYAGWSSRFNRDPNVLGKTIGEGDGAKTIIGVAPQDFKGAAFGLEPDSIQHLEFSENDRGRDNRDLIVIGRLKPGVSIAHARAEIESLSQQLAHDFPKDDKDCVAGVLPAGALPPGDATTVHLISGLMILSIGFILLIACANAANLLLAVAAARRQEALIKFALGATRTRLVREFLLESGILCVFSAVCAYLLAALAIAKFSEFQYRLPAFGELRIAANLRFDSPVYLATAAMIAVACIATGIAPALYGSSVHLASALSGEIAIGGTRKGVIRNGLVIVQVAISTLVLIGVALCYRSLDNLRHVDLGFSARNLAGIMAGNNEGRFKSPLELYAALRSAAMKIPGIQAVTLAEGMPMQIGSETDDVRGDDASKESVRARGGRVDGDYFAVAGIQLLAGRTFDARDREKTPEVVIVSKDLARKLWPDRDPVGRTLHLGGKRTATVIGVAPDVKTGDLDSATAPFMYFALLQAPRPFVTLIARTAGDPRAFTGPLARAALGLNLRLPIPPATEGDIIDLDMIEQIWTAQAVGIVSVLALVLSVLGLFGAVSYSVGERMRELGIRVALGARPSHLLRMIQRNTLTVAGSGVAIGVALGIAATVLLRSQFYGIRRVEFFALAPVALGMVALASLIAYLASRRATRVDPMKVLRHN